VIISLNGIKLLIFVMVKCGVPFEVRTDLLSIVKTRVGFKGLKFGNASSIRNYFYGTTAQVTRTASGTQYVSRVVIEMFCVSNIVSSTSYQSEDNYLNYKAVNIRLLTRWSMWGQDP
jgi:hypothetical protein